MAQKTVGHVELEWTCKRCGTKNPGLQKTCLNCGAPMSEQDQFDLPEQAKMVTDPAVLERAEQGQDIHCPFCGARNPAGAQQCSQCGGDLAEGAKRAAGRVLGALKEGPAAEITCPSCGSANPAGASRCQNCGGSLAKEATPPAPALNIAPRRSKIPLFGIAFGVILLAGLIYLVSMGLRKEKISAVVTDVRWERSVEVLAERPVEHEDWQDQVPSGAVLGACRDKVRSTQPDPAPGAEEVCGAPYTVDQGNGVGKVVQDCEYRIHDNWCSYQVNEWQVVETPRSQGNDLNPSWPTFMLFAGQREGDRQEDYHVSFQASGERGYNYAPHDAQQFSQFSLGSAWMLEVNGFGGVVNVEKR